MKEECKTGTKVPVHTNFIELSRVYTELWTLSQKSKIFNLFNNMSNLIHSNNFKNQHTMSNNNFTRKRKLPFYEIITFILSIPKKALNCELDKYFEIYALGNGPCIQVFL